MRTAMRSLILTGLVFLIAFGSPPAFALDTVVLKSGETITGRVLFEGPDRIVVRIGSKDREISPNDVKEVRSRARDAREVALSWEKL